jgi:predicted nuclease of predicted toxin-antitoxin system
MNRPRILVDTNVVSYLFEASELGLRYERLLGLAGHLAADRRRGGRSVPWADIYIAATALVNGLPVMTHDRDFADFRGVEVVTALTDFHISEAIADFHGRPVTPSRPLSTALPAPLDLARPRAFRRLLVRPHRHPAALWCRIPRFRACQMRPELAEPPASHFRSITLY